jgi:hypothetical protein
MSSQDCWINGDGKYSVWGSKGAEDRERSKSRAGTEIEEMGSGGIGRFINRMADRIYKSYQKPKLTEPTECALSGPVGPSLHFVTVRSYLVLREIIEALVITSDVVGTRALVITSVSWEG